MKQVHQPTHFSACLSFAPQGQPLSMTYHEVALSPDHSQLFNVASRKVGGPGIQNYMHDMLIMM